MTHFSRRTALFSAAAVLATRLLPTRLAAAIAANDYCPSAKERQVLKRLNALRARHGRSKLKMDRGLGAAARHHANDMAQRGYFKHKSPNGDQASDRARDHGYRGQRVGENIAHGYGTPERVMAAWAKSSGHRNNMLSREYRAVGVGFDPKGNYWVQVFGDEFNAKPSCKGRR
ncbi:MAG: CAP domain-containing protein [Chloroflexota bacterium]|nr:CAP domain-containing protein [Chloroflexota bacterium]